METDRGRGKGKEKERDKLLAMFYGHFELA